MTTDTSPILYWFRRDLRLGDNPGFHEACSSGRPVIAVFIRDETVDALGAAPKWRLGESIAALQASLGGKGGRLILRSGPASGVIAEVMRETGAAALWWSRLYDPVSIARDSALKKELAARGCEARSFPGHLLFEPWTVQTKTGGFYRVFSPMWRAVRDRDVPTCVPAPKTVPAPTRWPKSETLEGWQLGHAMQRGAQVVARHVRAGEAAAQAHLDRFLADRVAAYKDLRDRPDLEGTSDLSQYLSLGEISPRQIWQAGMRAQAEGKRGIESFLRQIVWREFAYHLMYHTPDILTRNWRGEWDGFPWQEDETHPHFIAWTQGRTGVAMVDAAMREMYVTGRMHNRARMLAASYLTKHLMIHWRLGLNWFAECLVDWDIAANAMGWQWVAGCGPDAAPYFRIFNPDTQQAKFDPEGAYVGRWIAERGGASAEALSYFDAIPGRWNLRADDSYPAPVVGVKEGRARALNAYENKGF